MPIAYLCLGSNLGDREKNLNQALGLLSQRVKIRKISSFYETEPVGYKKQPLFINIVCEVFTHLNPWELLNLNKEIETKLGREPSFANAPRPIDIDILFYNELILKSDKLTIPHPRLGERAFVLVPLAEIAPDFKHPENKKSVTELLAYLPQLEYVQRIKSEVKDLSS